MLFRGQNRDDPSWTLLPLAMRQDFQERFVKRHHEYVWNYIVASDRFSLSELNSKQKENLWIYVQRKIEEYIVRQFVRIADEARLYVPTDSYMEFGGEYKQPADDELFNAMAGDYPKLYEPHALAFALAQHHRIPTRLLDWTYKPLIAAFFAAYRWPRYNRLTEATNTNVQLEKQESAGCRKHTDYDDSNMVIWAISRSILNDKESSLRLITQLRSRIGNLQAQDGVFIYDICADEKYRATDEWVPFETEFQKVVEGNCVYKFLLPNAQRIELLRRLDSFGVSAPNIMPSFDTVANSALLYYSEYPHRLYWRYP